MPPGRSSAQSSDFDGQVVATISAVMRFGTAVEITTSQLRVELMFPADEATEAFFRARAPH